MSEDQSWIVKDADVLVISWEVGTKRIREHRIASVAPKSFVVGGDRYQKDTLKYRSPHVYETDREAVNPNTERGRELIAEMRLILKLKRAQAAALQFSRLGSASPELLEQADLVMKTMARFIAAAKAGQKS